MPSLGRSAGAMPRAVEGCVRREKSRPADLMYHSGSDGRMERSRRYVTDVTAVRSDFRFVIIEA